MHLGLEVLEGVLGVKGWWKSQKCSMGLYRSRGCACIHTGINIIDKLPLRPERYRQQDWVYRAGRVR